jgi:hypothetical protein
VTSVTDQEIITREALDRVERNVAELAAAAKELTETKATASSEREAVALQHLRDLATLRHEMLKLALDKADSENKEHLARLNGEAGRIAQVLAGTIPREVFEQYKETTEKALIEAKTAVAEASGSKGAFQWVWAAILAVIGLGALLYSAFKR